MPVLHNQPFAQPVIRVDNSVNLVSPNTLTKPQRQQVWSGIKGDNPELAKILTDPDFKALTAAFNGRVVFPNEELKRYLQAGK